jgi:hypothetical protein
MRLISSDMTQPVKLDSEHKTIKQNNKVRIENSKRDQKVSEDI